MKLEEIKNIYEHFFVDSSGNSQGECKLWWHNGQLEIHCYYKDGDGYGECKTWKPTGVIERHTFDINGEVLVDFLEEPDEYPQTEEDRLIFKLKYGKAPFLDEL